MTPHSRRPTRAVLLAELLAGPQGAGELARKLGIAPSAARRHLEALSASGDVEPVFRREGVGRPKKSYELTAKGRERMPRRYDAFALLLAKATADAYGAEGLARVTAQIADGIAAEHARPSDAREPLAKRVRRAAEVLTELGFGTEVEERDDRLVIVRRDCVFRRIADAHPAAVCVNLDTRLLTNIIGTPVEMTKCMAFGDGTCRHEIRRAPPAGRE